jgi:hypothetical protein
MQLTDEHLATFHEQGFLVVESFYPEEKRARIATAIRETHPPWEIMKDSEPEELPQPGLLKAQFPYDNMLFNELTIDWDLIGFIQRVLETVDIHFRYAHNWARYPVPLPPHKLHMDNGNNSLLPPAGGAPYGQISTWYFPEEVAENQAPMLIIPKKYGRDMSRSELLSVPAGTQMIFNTHIWHAATRFKRDNTQRYSVTRIYGRADHYWEGIGLFTNLGRNENFRKFVGTLTAREREVFRFPPVGHPIYTRENLALLEGQYPGWNARQEYLPGEEIEPLNDPHLFGVGFVPEELR